MGAFNQEEDDRIAKVDFLRKLDEGLEKTRVRMRKMLAGLTPKEQEILCKRFGVATIAELESGAAAGKLQK